MSRIYSLLATAFLLLTVNTQSVAEPSPQGTVAFDHYELHYSVFNSTFLQEDVAAIYGIKRSGYESLINISVTRKGEYGGLPAALSGTVTNLMQQQKMLEFIEIKEQGAVYYLAPVRISGEELVNFVINVTPENETQSLQAKFATKLYSDK